jgi:transglutaminase-like putative cysteine protease/predicted glutamine amidotransferase
MPNLFAMSFEGTLAPSFDLRCLHPGRKPPDGWGIGYYPGGEPSASVLKEPAPANGSIRSELVKAWDHLASSIFVVHIRTATWGQNSDANTQPFAYPFGGRQWLFGHCGSLRERLVLHGRFEPVGSTDTEMVFCDLLDRIAEAGWRAIGEADLGRLRRELQDLNEHGSLSIVMSDGIDLLCYADVRDDGPIYLAKLLPPYGPSLAFGDDDLWIDFTRRRGAINRKGVIMSSAPLALGESTPASLAGAGAPDETSRRPLEWTRVPAGHLLVVRQGAITAEVGRGPERLATPRKARPVPAGPKRAEPKSLEIVHRTTYRYAQPVERSTHLFRLVPIHDRLQSLLEHSLVLQADGKEIEVKHPSFEDVFGNNARRVVLEQPFRELVVLAHSRVRVNDTAPLEATPLHVRRAIPLVWMPWQREMMAPYILPAELPETQLLELASYAMTFVERNDYDLIGTLLDMNRSIFKEYKYSQGTTTLGTTAFDVYANRRGVCQDFTNLFICLARLLGVPARYVCGYIYTGSVSSGSNKSERQAQSEASHAWVQLYLPELGWKGFDPTNGVLTQTDHVRVAMGRNYGDATPTSGTIYSGGGAETLQVDVRVTCVE